MIKSDKILVVEDNEKNLYLIKFILQHAGLEVAEARSGEEAIIVAGREKPAMILMDMQLPGISGYKATELLKSDKELCEIPVVALTAYAMRGDKEKCFAAGCDEYLTKPIDPKTFSSTIAELLERVQKNGGKNG